VPISFERLVEYLDILGVNAFTAPHGQFWNVSEDTFRIGTVPGVKCNGSDIPIVSSHSPEESAFMVILRDPNGFCGKRQMPAGDSKATDPGFEIVLSDGSKVKGEQLLSDIQEWLSAK
jgi:hypothetical protein